MVLISVPAFIAYLAILYSLTGWNPQNLQGENLIKVNIATIVMIAIIGPTLVYGLKPKWDGYISRPEQQSKSDTIVSLEPLSNVLESKPVAASQYLGMGWSKNGISNELHVNFGVIRITALKGNLTRCHAQLKTLSEVSVSDAKTQQATKDKIWLDGGILNWHSQSLRENIAQNDTIDYFTLNKHFINTEADIREGDYRDLLFCFLIVPPFRTGQTS